MQNENKIDAWVDSTSAGAFEISRNALRKFAVLIQQAFLSAISDSSSGYKVSCGCFSVLILYFFSRRRNRYFDFHGILLRPMRTAPKTSQNVH